MPKTASQTVGIQIGAVSFVDEGTEQVLDNLEQRANVNTLFLAAFTYGTGNGGRQMKDHPFPDHGVQDYNDNFHGGHYGTPHPEYYKNTALKITKAPDHGNLDILEMVIPAAKKRGVKTYCWADDWGLDLPNVEKAREYDLYGRMAERTLCLNNPDNRNFWMGLVEDLTRSYDIDGIIWGSERQGALLNAFESIHNSNGNDPSRVCCFCGFCQAKARRLGIHFGRTREGFRALEAWVRTARAGQRPPDGTYVTFWRILFRYPELLAWETMWHDSLHETYSAIYDKVKSVKPQVQVGWHIWHAHGFSPYFRAQTDFKELSKYSDFLKITAYHNMGGPRMATYIDSIAATLYSDMPEDEALEFEYRILNYRERSRDQLPYTGLSSEYVYREITRAVEDVAGSQTQVLAGIDIDIPTREDYGKCTPENVKEMVQAAYRGGTHGLLLSRKYSEMKLANLGAVGVALREWKSIRNRP
jgi:hypothetical protein